MNPPNGRALSRLDLLREFGQILQASGKASIEARWILAHALQVDDKTLAADLFKPVPLDAAEVARAMLNLRLTGYPLQLLLGETEFFGLKLKVRKGVLIPRPETEGLVERALICTEGQHEPRVLDVGTGSGAIALAFKSVRPGASVWATDVSPEAIGLARENAERLGLEVEFIQAPFTAELAELDLVISNPPYLPDDYRQEAPPELAYEDEKTLYSGPEGLDMPRELLPHAWEALKPGGWLALELAPSNIYKLLEEAILKGWRHGRVYRDLAEQSRYLVLQKPLPEVALADEAAIVVEN